MTAVCLDRLQDVERGGLADAEVQLLALRETARVRQRGQSVGVDPERRSRPATRQVLQFLLLVDDVLTLRVLGALVG